MKVDTKDAYKLLYPRLTVLVSCGNEEKRNVLTIAWSTPVSFDPPLVGIAVSPDRYSHDLIIETERFGINIPTKEIAEETYLAGTKSGRDLDKLNELNLNIEEGNKGVPLIKECFANLECRLVNKEVFGDHSFFVGKIESAKVKEGALEENGFPDPKEKMLFWRSSGEKSDYLTF